MKWIKQTINTLALQIPNANETVVKNNPLTGSSCFVSQYTASRASLHKTFVSSYFARVFHLFLIHIASQTNIFSQDTTKQE